LSTKYTVKRMYLDRDKAGRNCSLQAIALNKDFIDESKLYKGYKDLNDYLVYETAD